MNITREIAKKVIDIVDAGLCCGVGQPKPGEMCVEAAVCYALGQPHGDEPACVGRAVRNFKITLNDSNWSSNKARAKGMRKLAVAQLGSDALDQRLFSRLLSLRATQRLLPGALRDFAEIALPEYNARLLEIALECEKATTSEEADASLARLARLASLDRLARLARLASLDRLDRLDRWARLASLASLARLASLDSLDRLDSPASFLTAVADVGLEVLIEMKSPGCEFLFLCEEEK